MAGGTSPTVRRIQLGKTLRGYREQAEMTRETVAEKLGLSLSAIVRYEQGSVGVPAPTLRMWLGVLGRPTDDETADQLAQLAKEGRQRGWFATSRGDLRATYRTLLGLEEDATQISEFSGTLVPGLLQTPEYARAIHLSAVPEISDAVIEERLRVRHQRQERFFTRPGARLHVILDEGCVLRKVGGDQVWRSQLSWLVEVGSRREMTIQVLPFDIGAHASTLGAFFLMQFDTLAPVVYLEMPAGDIIVEDPDSALYVQRFQALATAALPPTQSTAWISKVATQK